MNEELKKLVSDAFFTHSDINQHIPILYALANQCDHVTEFGVRHGTSSTAFLHSKAKVKSYDINVTGEARKLFDLAVGEGKNAELIEQDTLRIQDFENTDMLFIDTLHTYAQCIQELNLYHSYVRKFIVLHDTVLFGDVAEDHTQGLMYAVREFLSNHPEWELTITFANNNGLTVLSRK